MTGKAGHGRKLLPLRGTATCMWCWTARRSTSSHGRGAGQGWDAAWTLQVVLSHWVTSRPVLAETGGGPTQRFAVELKHFLHCLNYFEWSSGFLKTEIIPTANSISSPSPGEMPENSIICNLLEKSSVCQIISLPLRGISHWASTASEFIHLFLSIPSSITHLSACAMPVICCTPGSQMMNNRHNLELAFQSSLKWC